MKKIISVFLIILCMLSTGISTFALDLGECAIGGPVVKDQYLAWTGTDKRINIANIDTTNPISFKWKVTLDETSNFKPALLISTSRVYVFWTGLDGKINYIYCDESSASVKGRWDKNKVTLDDTSIAAPAVSRMHSEDKYGIFTYCDVLLCWTGNDKRINTREFYREAMEYYRSSNLYRGNKETLDEKSVCEPAILESKDDTRNYYTLAWTGTDRRLNYIISRDNNNFKDGDGKITSDYIKGAPSIYKWDTNKMFLGYSMTNNNLKHSIIYFDTGREVSYHNYSERTSNNAPAYNYNGNNNLIWADTNGALKTLRVIE